MGLPSLCSYKPQLLVNPSGIIYLLKNTASLTPSLALGLDYILQEDLLSGGHIPACCYNKEGSVSCGVVLVSRHAYYCRFPSLRQAGGGPASAVPVCKTAGGVSWVSGRFEGGTDLTGGEDGSREEGGTWYVYVCVFAVNTHRLTHAHITHAHITHAHTYIHVYRHTRTQAHTIVRCVCVCCQSTYLGTNFFLLKKGILSLVELQ